MISVVGIHSSATELDINMAINNKTGKNPKTVTLKETNDGKLQALVRLDSDAYHKLTEASYMVVNCSKCKVYDYTPIIRCFNCLRFGHMKNESKTNVTDSRYTLNENHVIIVFRTPVISMRKKKVKFQQNTRKIL